jgi:anthranilate phosphoribosyltransferase
VAGVASDLAGGAARAAQALDSGAALSVLERLRTLTPSAGRA